MKIEIEGDRVYVDGKEFVRKDIAGIITTIKEVRPTYGQGYTWLYLGFDLPMVKFSVGDKIRITKK